MRKIFIPVLIAAAIVGFLGFAVSTVEAQQKLFVSSGDCRWLVRHQPAPGVSYRPGVDVRGRAVAPADLDEGYPRIKVPRDLTFEVTAQLKKYLMGAQADQFTGEAVVGWVSVRGGKVYFNDQLLGDAAAHAIAEECKRMQREKGR